MKVDHYNRKKKKDMYKIRKIQFKNHEILGNLSLDFCDKGNKAVDTIIIAGENGTGKSTILKELFNIASNKVKSPCTVEFEINGEKFTLDYNWHQLSQSREKNMRITTDSGKSFFLFSNDFREQYPFFGIYSDTDINFESTQINTVTSLNLDSTSESRKSTSNLPNQIKQLLIDIQALDDADIAKAVKENPDGNFRELKINERMNRFTLAFNEMFEQLKYDRIINNNNHKEIIFKKNNKKFTIDNLSSGEKQIVYRGSFLLRDINSLNGAFVFIDEPETSLHPNWQKKILKFYKNIFTNEDGTQTSQLFVVTHSPFIIHNEYRENDKVIVLTHDNDNKKTIVKDKPEYYKCNSIEAIQDAFYISDFKDDTPTVYVEGRTDEKYFNKALEVFEYHVPFKIKWIGYIGKNGQEENTGKDALNKAVQFLRGRKLSIKNVCLYDCDANKKDEFENNVYIKTMPTYDNEKKMKKGIENALVLDNIDLSPYYSTRIQEGDYGDEIRIKQFDKMKLCTDICNKNNKDLKDILKNLKKAIDELIDIFDDKNKN